MIFHDTDWSSLQERSLLSFMTCDIGNLQTFKGHCLQRRIAVSKWIEKSFERLRSEEYSCRILRIMSLSVRQLDNVSILERVSFFYRFLGFLSIFWLGYYAVPVVMSHELLISVMEGKTPTTCGKMSPSQSHLLRFWSFGAFVWSFGRCPKWRWIFHVVFFFVKMLEVDFFPFRCYWYFCWRYICRLRSLMDCSHGKVMISERCGKSLMWDPYHRVSIQCD